MRRIDRYLFTLKNSIYYYTKRLKDKYITSLNKPIHIIFTNVDHYEPGTGKVSKDIEIKRVETLLERYPKLVATHRDLFGNIPKRTWFFPPHYHRYNSLKNLVGLAQKGFGEIELHIHHGSKRKDTPENLENLIRQTIKEYSEFGIFGDEDGQKKYGFIHGNFTLDNSYNGQYCGVDNEIEILLKTGCYADFTFPSHDNHTNPSLINSIFYAKENYKPKSYDKGVSIKINSMEENQLLMVQGPIFPYTRGKKISGYRLYSDVIDARTPINKNYLRSMLRSQIQIVGINNVIFLKTHIHGAGQEEVVLGTPMDNLFTTLENNFNDGKSYILHYATAREMYNIIMGLVNNPDVSKIEEYRNYRIKRPHYNDSIEIDEATNILKDLLCKTEC